MPKPTELLLVGGAALAILGFIQKAADMLDFVERIVTGYRLFYSSIWRSVSELLPSFLRPLDAPQTYDALTFISLIAATLVGKKPASQKYQLYDIAALGLLAFVFQTITVRFADRTLVDVVTTTTVNGVILVACIALALFLSLRKNADRAKDSTIQLAIALVAISTVVCMFFDSPRLMLSALSGDVDPSVVEQVHELRRAIGTAFVFTILGLAVTSAYIVRRPRKPLIAITVALAFSFWIASVLAGSVENALREANWIAES